MPLWVGASIPLRNEAIQWLLVIEQWIATSPGLLAMTQEAGVFAMTELTLP